MNKERVVVITGSAGQLGKAVTQRFLQGQDRLALFVHHSEQVDILQKEWKDFMERIHVSCVEMTKAAEYIEAGIRVNAILPSTMDTPQNRKNMPKANFATWVSPHSIAQVIHFLASVEANDITGAAIPVGRL